MESLYFIAVIPPVKIQEEIGKLKQLVADRFESNHALNAPSHITLQMPFKWENRKLDQLKDVLGRLNSELIPFEVELRDFDFFEPRVVFIDVVKNDALDRLQKSVVDICRRELKLHSGNYKNQGFHPHVTIGFRDLKKPMFYESKTYFEKEGYANLFKVEQISLLRKDGKMWKSIYL